MRRGNGAEERDDAGPLGGVREETPRGPVIYCDRYGHERELLVTDIGFQGHSF